MLWCWFNAGGRLFSLHIQDLRKDINNDGKLFVISFYEGKIQHPDHFTLDSLTIILAAHECWTSYGKKNQIQLSQYGSCWSKGLQRVVLFTEEQRIYKLLCESEKAQLAEQEIILSLKNMGVSLVNNSSSQEVSFIGITRSITTQSQTYILTLQHWLIMCHTVDSDAFCTL